MATKSQTVMTHRVATDQVALPANVSTEGTRRKILEAALRLFADNGYGSTSIREIAERVGVQSASLYAHYPSKAHVLAELVTMGHVEHQRRLRDALLRSGPTPSDQLRALVRAHVIGHAEFSLLAVVANTEMSLLPPELSAPAVALRDESVQTLIEIVERGAAAGDFDAPEPLLVAAAIGAMGMRVAHWYHPGLDWSPEHVADEYATYALRMVGATT